MGNDFLLGLKVSLMQQGLKLSPAAISALKMGRGSFVDNNYYVTTSGLAVVIPSLFNLWVNVPIVKKSRFTLMFSNGIFSLRQGAQVFEVKPMLLPEYYFQTNTAGLPYNQLMSTQTDRVNVFPILGCAFSCQFCPLSYTQDYGTNVDVETYVKAIRRAFKDRVFPARHLQITGGVPRREDFEYYQKIIEGILKAFPKVPIDIMMAPIPGLLNLNKMKRLGLNGVAFNLEIYNQEVAKRYCPQKYASLGRCGYLAALKEAVNILGPGRVRSLLLVGLEPIQETLRGVSAIAKTGADPVLSPFIPAKGSPLERKLPPSQKLLREVYLKARSITDRYKVQLGPRCLPCQHNTLSIPY